MTLTFQALRLKAGAKLNKEKIMEIMECSNKRTKMEIANLV